MLIMEDCGHVRLRADMGRTASGLNIVHILHYLDAGTFQQVRILRLQNRLYRSVIIIFTDGQTLIILDPLEKDFRATFDINHVILEEFEEDFDVLHTDEHHAPGELVILVSDKRVNLKNVLCLLLCVKLE